MSFEKDGVTFEVKETSFDERLFKLWASEEWSVGEQTAYSNFAAYHSDRLFVVELDDSKELIGSLLLSSKCKDQIYMSFFFIKREYRGKGIGRTLWNHVIESAGATANLSLDSVPEMVKKYEKGGFCIEDSKSNLTVLVKEVGEQVDVSVLKSVSDLGDSQLKLSLLDLSEESDVLISKLFVFDHHVHGEVRLKFLHHFLSRGSNPMTMVVSKIKPSKSQDRDDEVECLGYGCIIVNNLGGVNIGPIYAESNEICEILLKGLLQQTTKNLQELSIETDVMQSTKGAVEIFTRIGFKELFTCKRLYTRFVPETSKQLNKIYALHSVGFGIF